MAYDQDAENYNRAINQANCDAAVWYSFEKGMKEKLLQVDAQLLVSVILAGIMVGIGAYGQRYRHRPLTRIVFLGASTLFSPIISSVVTGITGYVSSISSHNITEFVSSVPTLTAMCTPTRHSVLVITWALLVQNIMINTSIIVAVDDREGASLGPPLELLAQGAWMFYLGFSFLTTEDTVPFFYFFVEVLPFLLILAKLSFKYYALKKAQQSFSFACNPPLVSGYMQLQIPLQLMVVGEHAPPPLLVMGEDTKQVEKQHYGYVFKDDSRSRTVLHKGNGLVTLDSIWQLLDSRNSMLLVAGPSPQSLRDLCLSFALFKLLRCRFARCETAITGSTSNMFNIFWSSLLKDGEPDRIFGVIANELSFLNGYYYSSLPISYSKCWLPILGIVISLLSIGYCCFIVPVCIMIRIHELLRIYDDEQSLFAQIHCYVRCKGGDTSLTLVHFGSIFFDLVPLVLLLVFVVIAEARDIVSYICSNWTKVVLTCRLLSEQSQSLQKWSVRLLRCRCKFMTLEHWDEEMGQCSVLPHRLRPRITPHALVRRLLHLPDQTKINPAVKVSIIDALRSITNNGAHLSNGRASLYRWGQQGTTFLWACNSKSTSDIILTWHIATSILEVRHPFQQQGSSSVTSDGHKIVATHLSRYCAYLMTYYPEMLPDNAGWSKSLYDAVKEDAEYYHYLSRLSSTPDYYQQLVQLLDYMLVHPVLKNGVKLGKQLVETINVEEAWKLLANFWSEMILYVAPSDNLKGHKESIARGGELITILWALLNHAGIISRTTRSDDDAARSAAPGTSSAGVV